MIMKYNRIFAVVEVHAQAKFHQAKFSGLLVIVATEKTRSLAIARIAERTDCQ